MEIRDVLRELEHLIKQQKRGCQFNPPANPERICHVEQAFDIRLPGSYKQFLERFNGGFMYKPSLEYLMNKGELETVMWNSFTLFSLEEVVIRYEDLADRSWHIYDFEGPYPYIPFASTATNEILVFVNRPWGASESPVFDAFHEEPAAAWGIVAPDFTTFLKHYIDHAGNPETIGETANETAEDLRWEPSSTEWKGLQKPKAVIRRTTAYLKLYPGNREALTERRNALLQSGELDLPDESV